MDLTIIKQNDQLLVDSRDVARMTEKEHKHLLRDIKGYIEVLTESNFGPSNFFIESTYRDSTGRTLPCYLLTRKGCDMVANKMIGEKGVLFTAAYVTKFEEMERSQSKSVLPSNFKEALLALVAQVEENEKLQTEKLMLEQRVAEYEPKATYVDLILQSKSTITTTQIAKDYGLSANRLNRILHEEKVQFKQNGQWLLYAKHHDCGYTKSRTFDYFDSNGERRVKMNTEWTQKGRLFIHELLNRRGILPYMDRKQEVSI